MHRLDYGSSLVQNLICTAYFVIPGEGPLWTKHVWILKLFFPSQGVLFVFIDALYEIILILHFFIQESKHVTQISV
jgi:hypothetical protein